MEEKQLTSKELEEQANALLAEADFEEIKLPKKAKKAAEDDDWDWDPSDSHAGADDGAANTAGAIDAPTQVIDSVPSDKE